MILPLLADPFSYRNEIAIKYKIKNIFDEKNAKFLLMEKTRGLKIIHQIYLFDEKMKPDNNIFI